MRKALKIFIIFCIIFTISMPTFNAVTTENTIRYRFWTYNILKEKIKEEKLYIKTDEIVYTKTSVNIRTGPSKRHEKITTLPINTELKRIAIGENGWSKIIYNGKTCYINSNYLSYEKIIEEKYTSTYIKTHGNIKTDLIKLADQQWYKIPEATRNILINNGWEIIITTEDLATKYGYSGSIAGITEFAVKKIYLENRHKAIQNALIHEVGHAIDAINGYPSANAEFINIFINESPYFKDSTSNGDGHESSNTTEYFASVFSEAVINKKNCEATAPSAYGYIQNYMK